MRLIERTLKKQLISDLNQKMVILAGPRQVGKTQLAKSLAPQDSLYLNYDISEHRRRLLRQEFAHTSLWIFDELHKYKTWKNYLKGVVDQHGKNHQILVTGSARLDLLRKSGDSLQGRYHYLRLYPLTLGEIKSSSTGDLKDLFSLSGFPEPFIKSSKTYANRWSNQYQSRLIQEDINSLEQVSHLGLLEQLSYRLPECVGGPLSVNNLREDLQVNFATAKRWIELFERYYYLFRIAPFGSPKIKALKKEQKHYHFDWNLVSAVGPRFENLIAVHLLKYVHFMQDTQGDRLDLRYYKDIEGREIDFIVTEKNIPRLAIECKSGDDEISKALIYFKRKFPQTECWQLHLNGKKDYVSADGIRVAPAPELLKDLP